MSMKVLLMMVLIVTQLVPYTVGDEAGQAKEQSGGFPAAGLHEAGHPFHLSQQANQILAGLGDQQIRIITVIVSRDDSKFDDTVYRDEFSWNVTSKDVQRTSHEPLKFGKLPLPDDNVTVPTFLIGPIEGSDLVRSQNHTATMTTLYHLSDKIQWFELSDACLDHDANEVLQKTAKTADTFPLRHLGESASSLVEVIGSKVVDCNPRSPFSTTTVKTDTHAIQPRMTARRLLAILSDPDWQGELSAPDWQGELELPAPDGLSASKRDALQVHPVWGLQLRTCLNETWPVKEQDFPSLWDRCSAEADASVVWKQKASETAALQAQAEVKNKELGEEEVLKRYMYMAQEHVKRVWNATLDGFGVLPLSDEEKLEQIVTTALNSCREDIERELYDPSKPIPEAHLGFMVATATEFNDYTSEQVCIRELDDVVPVVKEMLTGTPYPSTVKQYLEIIMASQERKCRGPPRITEDLAPRARETTKKACQKAIESHYEVVERVHRPLFNSILALCVMGVLIIWVGQVPGREVVGVSAAVISMLSLLVALNTSPSVVIDYFAVGGWKPYQLVYSSSAWLVGGIVLSVVVALILRLQDPVPPFPDTSPPCFTSLGKGKKGKQ